ncbi:hypothetical protein A2U01_0005160, partial [Trifolium medium]|nr:hypothetical protein [Trifolium medium]
VARRTSEGVRTERDQRTVKRYEVVKTRGMETLVIKARVDRSEVKTGKRISYTNDNSSSRVVRSRCGQYGLRRSSGCGNLSR